MKTMNHAEYQKKMKTLSWACLEYICDDAREAIATNPDNENNGYYQDEINYASNEMFKRKSRNFFGASVE